jgi:hypothetical protein
MTHVLHETSAGCKKTILVQQNFEGMHIWEKPGFSGLFGLFGWSGSSSWSGSTKYTR